jgi:hypothetical protein
MRRVNAAQIFSLAARHRAAEAAQSGRDIHQIFHPALGFRRFRMAALPEAAPSRQPAASPHAARRARNNVHQRRNRFFFHSILPLAFPADEAARINPC